MNTMWYHEDHVYVFSCSCFFLLLLNYVETLIFYWAATKMQTYIYQAKETHLEEYHRLVDELHLDASQFQWYLGLACSIAWQSGPVHHQDWDKLQTAPTSVSASQYLSWVSNLM